MRTNPRPSLTKGERVVRLIASGVMVLSLLMLASWLLNVDLFNGAADQVVVKTNAIVGLVGVMALILAVVVWLYSLRLDWATRDQRLVDTQPEQRMSEHRSETEQAQLLDAASYQLQRGVLDGTVLSVIATEPDGIIREFNARAERMLGYAREEMVGKQVLTIVHLDQEVVARAAELSVMLNRKIESGFEVFVAQARLGKVDEREWTYVRKDGTRLPVLLSVTALRDKKGVITGFLGVAQDLTNRRNVETALRTSEERLHRVLDHADCLVWEAKVELIEKDWSWQMTIHPSGLYRRLSGQQEPVASVGLWYQFEVPEREEMNRRSRVAMESGLTGYVQEFRLLRDGQVVWIRESVSVSKLESGKFWLVGVAVDITESRQAKTTRDEIATRLSKLGSMLPGMIYQLRRRPDGRTYIPYSSAGIQQIYRVTPEQVCGDASDLFAVTHPEDAARLFDTVEQSARTLQPWQCEYRVRFADGSEKWLLGNSVPEREADGGVLWHGFITDITERKAAEAALARSNKEIQDLKVAMDEHSIVAITDPSGRITYANDKLCKASKYSRAELLGKDYRMLNSGHHSKEFMDTLWATIVQGRIWKGEIRDRAQDDSFYWIDTTIVPFVNSEGKPTQYVVISSDITELKQLEASLVQARDQALEASKLKSEFLATMSHEIRTPMNAIIGMAGFLVETPLDPQQTEMAQTIVGGAESLLSIINDILDFSRIEAGRMRIDPVEFDFIKLVQETIALLANRAREKQIKLTTEVIPWSGALLSGDSGRVRQVLVNLIGNAIKFTDAGEVKVTVRAVSETETGTRLRVEIRDTGIGIPQAAQGKIFQPFVQADGSTTRRFGGTGLGLAISSQLVELMGGAIGFESEEGKGSIFWTELGFLHSKSNHDKSLGGEPSAGRESAVGLEKKPGKQYGLRILLVEDNLANRQVGMLMLEKMGCSVEVATNGVAALEQLALHHYDAVLMDCQMPILDGYETTRRIRSGALPRVSATVPIIALTAYARSEDRAKCLAAGMTDYVSKPIRQVELEAAFDRSGIDPAPVAVTVEPTMDEDPVIDRGTFDTLLALKDNKGRSVMHRIVNIYLDEEAGRLDRLEQLIQKRQDEELAQEAHSFGSNAVSFGGLQVRRVALELENSARAANWPAVADCMITLRTACTRLKHELSQIDY